VSEIIDFHIHPLHDWQFGDRVVKIDLSDWRKELEAFGIRRACGSVIYRAMEGRPVSEYEQLVPQLNNKARECREEMGEFYLPGIHVHPAFVEMSCAEIDKAYQDGIRLVGELVPYMMGWRAYASPEMLEIFSFAAEKGMVVSLHPTYYDDMDALATALPHLNIVYAHLSGKEEQLALMMKHDNVYYDFCAHGGDREGMLRYSIDRVGVDRILFGTDFPGGDVVSDLEAALSGGLTSEELEAVLGSNARRLLGLN